MAALAAALLPLLGTSPAHATPSKLVYGSDQDFPPFEFLDKRGQAAGFNVELIQAIGREVGVDIEVRLGPWPEIRRALETEGTIDIADMYFSETRAADFEFSHPFDLAYDQLFVRVDEPAPCTLEDLDDKRVLVQAGSFTEEFLRGLSDRIRLTYVDSEPDGLRRLAQGEADCAIASQITGQHTVRTLGLTNITGTGAPINPRTYSFVVKKGRSEIIELIDRGLTRVKQSGEFSAIYQRWLSANKNHHESVWLRYAAIVAGVLAVLGLIALLLVYSLRRTVRARTAALELELRQRARAEEALRSSEDRLRVLVERAPEAIVVFEAGTFQTLDANGNALELLGVNTVGAIDLRTASQLATVPRPGEEALTMLPEPPGTVTRAGLERHCQEAFDAGEAVFEWQLEDAGGAQRITEVRLVPFPDPTRSLLRASIVDISERRALLAQLLHSQRLESVGRLAGGIAHDFNNLLTVLIGQADFLRRSLPDDPDLVGAADDIEMACNRAATLTRQLLAFSRRQVMRMEAVEVNQVIAGLENMFRRSLGEDIDLVLGLTDAPATIVIDPAQLEQALLNLAVNARDAMPRGGTLRLSTAIRPVAEGDDQSLTEVVIEVADTGEGMTPEVQQRIFEPFFTTKEAGHGTGLGLAMVHGIVHQSGGSIAIKSAPGEGTTISFIFPRHLQPATHRDATLRPVTVLQPGHEAVLIVEDEADVRILMVSTLRECGYQVSEAARPSEALALADGAHFDLLITDVVMPEMSGRELADKLRSRIPSVLYVTGYSRDQMLRQRGLASSERILDKPFRAQDLADAVRAALNASTASKTGGASRAGSGSDAGLARPLTEN